MLWRNLKLLLYFVDEMMVEGWLSQAKVVALSGVMEEFRFQS